jgi:hypothetical protein
LFHWHRVLPCDDIVGYGSGNASGIGQPEGAMSVPVMRVGPPPRKNNLVMTSCGCGVGGDDLAKET